MTESCSCITAHPPDKYDYKYAHAVGTIVASTEVKIVDLDGKELGLNQPGEVGRQRHYPQSKTKPLTNYNSQVLARGPQIVMGYLSNPKATSETFDSDGWLHTGDQGFLDDEGLLTITDRIKEMIKVKGIGVAPAEIEDLLLGHPKVEDVAVLGLQDEYSGERPKAYVVLNKGVQGGKEVEEELIGYVRERKVKHKWITEVEFVEVVPKSASGKILRRVLRDQSKGLGKNQKVRDEVKEKAKL